MSIFARVSFVLPRLYRRRSSWMPIVVACLAAPWLASPSAAETIKLDAVTTGSFTSGWAFRDHPLNVGYSPWADNSGDPLHNNYLIFDLAPVAGYQITAATLRIWNLNDDYTFLPAPYCPDSAYGSCPVGYISPDPSETYAIWDVTTPISQLMYGGPVSASNPGIVLDLGSGIQFGSTVVTAANTGVAGKVDVAFNSAGLSYLNAALSSGDFTRAIGGSVTTLSGSGYQELLFAGSGPYTNYPIAARRLILEVQPLPAVPVPAAVWLFGSALGVMGVMRRKISS